MGFEVLPRYGGGMAVPAITSVCIVERAASYSTGRRVADKGVS